MIGFLPPRPVGSDRQSRFMQWVWDSLQTLRPVQTPDSATNSTTRGFSTIQKPKPGGAQEPAPPQEVFLVVAANSGTAVINGNVLACKRMVGGEAGTPEAAITYVARPFKLRPITGRLIAGKYWSYSYDAAMTFRTASAAATASENQVIVPRYIVGYAAVSGQYAAYAGDLIYARKLAAAVFQINTGTVAVPVLTDVSYVDCNNDARAWARENG